MTESIIDIIRAGVAHVVTTDGGSFKNPGQILELADALSKNTTLERFTLSGAAMSEMGVKAFAKAVAGHPALECLVLTQCQTDATGAAAIADALADNTTLKSLHLNHTLPLGSAMPNISRMLQNKPTLEELCFHSDAVQDLDIEALEEGFAASGLRELDLPLNRIRDKGAAAMARAFAKQGKLEKLNLASNRVGNDGAKALAEYLTVDTKLQSLDLTGNAVEDEGAKELANALRINHTLCSFALTFTNIGTEGEQALATAILDSGNRNIISAHLGRQFPALNKVCEHNREMAMDCLRAWQGDPEIISTSQLYEYEERGQALRFLANTHYRTPREQIEMMMQRFEETLKDRPSLESITLSSPDQLTTHIPEKNGYTPLDNPRVWRNFSSAAETLMMAGAPIRKTDLAKKSVDGASFLQIGMECGQFSAIAAALAKSGDRLTAADLVARDGTPTATLGAIIKNDDTAKLFSPEVWSGAHPAEVRRVFSALPEEAKSHVTNWHALSATLQRQYTIQQAQQMQQ